MPLFAPTAGDVLYPSDPRFAGDAADLVELRIRPVRGAIVYRVTFGAPSAAGTVVAGIGIRSGPNGGAAPVAWPFGAGISSPGLNWFITAWGSGGAVTQFAGGRTVMLPAGAVRWSSGRAQMTIRVPLSLMNPHGATWRYVAGTGLWDGHGWTPVVAGAAAQREAPVSGNPLIGAPAVFNLAFRFHEPVAMSQLGGGGGGGGGGPYTSAPGIGNWFEDGQARNLASRLSGDDFADVDFGALARGVSRFVHAPGSVQARIYGSRLPIAPGVDHNAFPEFGGALQPYLVRVPPGYRPGRATPVMFALHASNSDYELYNVFMPNWGRELGDGRGSFVVTPLGHGLNGPDPNSGAFTGAAEADFFETWADLARHFTIDRSRITVSGYSLGAYAAYALAETWPDLFANVFSVVGAPPSNGMNTELLGNLRWEPLLTWNQADDSQVPYTDASAAEAKLTALGLRHEAWVFPAGGHLAPALRDDWRPAVGRLDDARVVRNPPRIELGVFPALDDRPFGLVHDHAYWVSGVRVSGGSVRGNVDARSRAFGVGDPVAVQYSGAGQAGGSTAVVHGVRWANVPAVRRVNSLRLTLTDISAMAVDGRRARLRGDRPLVVWIQSNVFARVLVALRFCGRARVRLSGPRGGRARVRRRALTIAAAPGISVVQVPSISCARLRRASRRR
jgi:hypothetical protein